MAFGTENGFGHCWPVHQLRAWAGGGFHAAVHEHGHQHFVQETAETAAQSVLLLGAHVHGGVGHHVLRLRRCLAHYVRLGQVSPVLSIACSIFFYQFNLIYRLTPFEWVNPHPCDPEPEELENSFTILDSMYLDRNFCPINRNWMFTSTQVVYHRISHAARFWHCPQVRLLSLI